MSLGERFRAAREQRGLTLSEVAEHLRIRSVYLAAIEDENWSAIGAPVYARGFLRTYARYLDLDPQEAVAGYNASASSPAQPPPSPDRPVYRERSGLLPALWVAGIIALALIGFLVYVYISPPRGQAYAPSASSAPLAVTNPAATPSSPMPSPFSSSAPLKLSRTLGIHLSAPSWLRVTVDGNVSIEGTFPAGTSKTFHGNSVLVRVGNAGGVQITVDGKPLGPLGADGDVVEKSFSL